MLTILQCIGQHRYYPDQKLHITKVDLVQKSPLLLDNWTYVTKTSIFGVSRSGVQFWLKAWPWEFKLCWEDPLEEGVATHSSMLAWSIPMDRGAWPATVHRVAKSGSWLGDLAHMHARLLWGILSVSTVHQSESATCAYPLFSGFPSHLGHHRAVSTEFPGLCSRFWLVFYFIQSINRVDMFRLNLTIHPTTS